MKDDSLSDVQQIVDGGYCSKCDTVWVAPGRCNCSVVNTQKESTITYEYVEDLPIPTYHCKCGQDNIGFSVCLKCNPLTYSVGIRPEDEKALKAAYKYESVLARNIWNEAIEAAANLFLEDADRICDDIRKLKK